MRRVNSMIILVNGMSEVLLLTELFESIKSINFLSVVNLIFYVNYLLNTIAKARGIASCFLHSHIPCNLYSRRRVECGMVEYYLVKCVTKLIT